MPIPQSLIEKTGKDVSDQFANNFMVKEEDGLYVNDTRFSAPQVLDFIWSVVSTAQTEAWEEGVRAAMEAIAKVGSIVADPSDKLSERWVEGYESCREDAKSAISDLLPNKK